MSQRLGMADGRCYTLNTSSQLLNNYIMNKNNISLEDNYRYRQILQQRGPDLIAGLQSTPSKNNCGMCEIAPIDTKNIY